MSSNLVEIKTMESYLKIIHTDMPIVLDFSAAWCGPCKKIFPKIVDLSKEYPEIIFAKIDIDSLEELANQYTITSVPTFKFVLNGTEHAEVCGANIDKVVKCTEKLWELFLGDQDE